MFVRLRLLLLTTAALVAGCDAWVGAESLEGQECPREETGPPPGRLLTRREYRNTVFDLLGETEDPTTSFPNEPEVNGYSNDAISHIANPRLVESWFLAAESLAHRARLRNFAGIVSCSTADEACATTTARQFGRRAFRRPLTQEELDALVRLYRETRSSQLEHEDGLEAMLIGVLSSPQFLYRIEAPAENKTKEEASDRLLGSFELASRLSYFIVGSLPDDELLAKAEHDQLQTEMEIEAETERLLKDPRAKEQMREFFRRWLGVTDLPLITREGTSDKFGAALLESLLRYTDSMLWGDRTVADLFTSPDVFLGEDLEGLFTDMNPEAGVASAPDTRHGLLTQPALLSLNAHPDQGSPIARGVFVRRRILCAPVTPPPPDVNNNPPDPDPNLTTRELFNFHTENPACRSCHELLDPLGFGFEGYDQLGRFRREENGRPIDASGALVDTRDPSLDGAFKDARELAEKVSQSSSVLECLTTHLFTFSLGRDPGVAGTCSRDALVEQHPMAEATVKDVIKAITTSYVFRYRQPFRIDDLPTSEAQ